MKTWKVCVAIILAGFCPAGRAQAADTLLKPFIALSEEFTDNVFELSGNKRTEYITRVRPGTTFRYQSPLWTWDADYTFEFRNYARNSKGNEYNHDGAVKGTVSLVENFLFLDLNDTYHRVSLDVSRTAATESSLFLNQTDQNVATVSPYLLWRLKGDNTLKTGYRYSETRYWGNGIERREQAAFADLNHEFSTKLSVSAGYGFSHLESHPTTYDKHDLSGGFRYEYAEKSFLYAQVGNSWQQFKNSGTAHYLFWNAGLTHDFSGVVATAETRVQTATDPLAVSTRETSYSCRLEKSLQRGLLGVSVSYAEYVNTVTDAMDRNRLGISLTGRYELLQDITTTATATGERFSTKTPSEYPYRITGIVGLSYAFKDEFTVGLTYTYVNNLYDLDTTAGANQINKAVVELKKVF